MKIYYWAGINWYVLTDPFSTDCDAIPLCSKKKCNCKLIKLKEPYSIGEYKYGCIKCDYKITLNKSIEDKAVDFLAVYDSLNYKDAEVINIDGELIRIQRKEEKDSNYWIDVKLSKNNKDELQLMVLAGSKKTGNKTQLFLEPKSEKLSFDQNNDHPRSVFTVVNATFKKSKTSINVKKKKNKT